MAIRVAINHKTEYRYDQLVNLSPHIIRLRPAVHSRTRVHSYSLRIRAERTLHQLAAGPVRQLPGAVAFSGKD